MVGKVLVIPELQGGTGDEMRWIPMEHDPLTMLYREIECTTVELVRLGDTPVPGLSIYLDEEGLFKKAPQYNVRAMALILGVTGALHQVYVGNAVVARVDDEGEDVGLLPEQMRVVRLIIRQHSRKVEAWMGAQSVRRS